jgi:hypothetical protein
MALLSAYQGGPLPYRQVCHDVGVGEEVRAALRRTLTNGKSGSAGVSHVQQKDARQCSLSDSLRVKETVCSVL